MPFFFRSSRLRFIGGTYGLLVAIGGLQFLVTVVLARTLSAGDFSRVTYILTTYNTFLPLVDLGLQTEAMRRFVHPEQVARYYRPLLWLRFRGAGVAFLVMLTAAAVGGLSSEGLAGQAVFAASMLPVGALLSTEALGYAEENIAAAATLRLGRALGLLGLGVLAMVLPQTMALSATRYVLLFLPFPVLLTGVCLLAKRIYQPSVPSEDSARTLAAEFFLQNINLPISIGLWCLLHGIFSSWNLRIHGDQYLGPYNVAMVLLTPLTLFLQVIMHNTIIHRERAARASHPLTRQSMILSLALLGTIIYGLVFTHPSVAEHLFPNVSSGTLPYYFWPLLCMQVGLAGVGILYTDAQRLGQKQVAVYSPLAGLITLLVGMVLFSVFELPAVDSALVYSVAIFSALASTWRLLR